MKVKTIQEYRLRRHLRLRQKVKGTADRPRMAVFVSNNHLYIQFVDDDASRTLCAACTLQPEMRDPAHKCNVETAKRLGAFAAKAAIGKGISAVVFDRGGFTYAGRIKALAEAAREAGLKF